MGVVVVLLGATAVAFGRIEGLKLEPDPITGPAIDKRFSPTCRCPQHVAHISFRLVKAGRLTVSIIGADGRVRQTLARDRAFRSGRLNLTWSGRTHAGRVAPDGLYRVSVDLGSEDRTIVLPRGTVLDTKRPVVRLVSAAPRTFSPDGDYRRDSLVIRYTLSKPAHIRLTVDGVVAIRGRYARTSGRLYWSGAVHGRPLPAGAYRLALVAEDLAGNLSQPPTTFVARIRFVGLSRVLIRTRARATFGVRILSDAATVHWRFLSKTGVVKAGVVKPGRLVLRAGRPGRYRLRVEANGHVATATVVVTPRS
jgi:hypothetical protein